MAEIFQQLYSINIVSYVGVEDFADRLSFQITVTLLTACCGLTTFMCYIMRPVACFQHNTFGEFMDGKDIGGQIEYSTNFCWTEGTYAVHPNNFSIDITARDGGMSAYADKKIVYYQWVPFLLALQALMFYLPRLLWNSISYDRAGTDVGHIIKVASDAGREEEEAHDKLITYAVRMIEVMLDRTHKCHEERPLVATTKNKCSSFLSVALPSRISGSWLIFTYLVVKLTYASNAVAQLVLMQYFLQLHGSHYHLLGISLLSDIVRGHDWHNSMAFPRVGCCAVFMRSGAAGNWQFCQCTLPVNIINEKIYIFLWFWFIFVAAATLLSTIVWLYRLVNASLTCRFVKKYLRLADNYSVELRNRKRFLRNFTHQFLRRDGAFVLKMVALNAGDVVCAEIIQRLWQHYLVDEGFSDDGEAAEESLLLEEGSEQQQQQPQQAELKKPETGILKLSCDRLPPKLESSRRRLRRSSLGTPTAAAAEAAAAAAATAAEDPTVAATLPQKRCLKGGLSRGVSFHIDEDRDDEADSEGIKS
ncbi:hypothetical protein BOX15_Mlig014703g1 [Macrostomum lignano]|uniref:Innexin n=1 Tax=Macrostomum lignano TaxID=282301 RepID=A0A267FD39_9PLAT|nr:hypothetical protein BOX15_Mlig014703g1 [Macrostomum lignano]